MYIKTCFMDRRVKGEGVEKTAVDYTVRLYGTEILSDIQGSHR